MASENKKNASMSDAQRVQQADIARAKSMQPKDKPLVEHIYTADPSAHVFNDQLYIYPSHDIESAMSLNDDGDHYAMEDYCVLSLTDIGGKVTDHGIGLHVNDVAWAEKQMWAPDAAKKGDKYYLYFPAKDYSGVFKIGVAIGDQPQGPFIAEPEAIKGSYSIDPAVFEDDDGSYYMYFGGIWGGQLQNWRTDKFNAIDDYPHDSQPALTAKVAKLTDDMLEFEEEDRDIEIVDEHGTLITQGDVDRRYFEGPWMHKFNGQYYFSYSTGDTHKIVYATSDSPYGPFTYQGVILEPVLGWTTHHSIAEFKGKWYLFYHDSELSNGQSHLRCVKMTELTHDENGKIKTLNVYS